MVAVELPWELVEAAWEAPEFTVAGLGLGNTGPRTVPYESLCSFPSAFPALRHFPDRSLLHFSSPTSTTLLLEVCLLPWLPACMSHSFSPLEGELLEGGF